MHQNIKITPYYHSFGLALNNNITITLYKTVVKSNTMKWETVCTENVVMLSVKDFAYSLPIHCPPWNVLIAGEGLGVSLD